MSKWKFFTTRIWEDLYPLGAMHKFGNIRIGSCSLETRWSIFTEGHFTYKQQNSESKVHQLQSKGELNDSWLPSEKGLHALLDLPIGSNLYFGEIPLFVWNPDSAVDLPKTQIELDPARDLISSPEQLFKQVGDWILEDFQWLRNDSTWFECKSTNTPSHVTIIGRASDVIMQEEVRLTACTLNTEDGPIILERGCEIQEGCHLRGPLFVGAHTVVKMGTRIYGPTAIGPDCRIGGEISNCVFLGYSNKGHDGFLGNSIIGCWCNLGADTNTSNLKSNYSRVRLWSERRNEFRNTDMQFCGLIMGDHSKCGINTMFNTGTIVGAGCNIFGGGFQPKHIPPFSWGGGDEWSVHEFDKFVETAVRVMSRRGHEMSEHEQSEWRLLHDTAVKRGNN